jgi:Family of unknown function (DUF6152)
MKAKLGFFLVVLGLSYLTVPLLAHHGFDTEYDKDQKLTLTGVVTQVSWMNPHMRVYIDVTDKDGVVTNYNCELDSPNNVRRLGWGKNDLVPGDKVNFEANPGKIVKNRAALVTITKVGETKPLFKRGKPQSETENAPKQ